MATQGAMADFARMPPQRKVMLFVIIGAVLGLLYWKMIYSSLDESLREAQGEHDAKVSKNRQLAANIPRYAELRTHVAKLRELIEKNQTALPSEAELAAFIETLQRKVQQAGVETRRWTYRTPEPVETFIKVPFEVEMTGTFMQIKRFFASLVQHDVRLSDGDDGGSEADRIVSIENLSLSNPQVKDREIILNAKFTAVTFRQEDKAQVQLKPAPGSPARPAPPPKAAPPPVPTTAPPPLPSSTPAGAKAKVDDAVEKNDARNRGGAGADEAKLPPAQPPGAGSARLKGGL